MREEKKYCHENPFPGKLPPIKEKKQRKAEEEKEEEI